MTIFEISTRINIMRLCNYFSVILVAAVCLSADLAYGYASEVKQFEKYSIRDMEGEYNKLKMSDRFKLLEDFLPDKIFQSYCGLRYHFWRNGYVDVLKEENNVISRERWCWKINNGKMVLWKSGNKGKSVFCNTYVQQMNIQIKGRVEKLIGFILVGVNNEYIYLLYEK